MVLLFSGALLARAIFQPFLAASTRWLSLVASM
jgi:hypothetical protein